MDSVTYILLISFNFVFMTSIMLGLIFFSFFFSFSARCPTGFITDGVDGSVGSGRRFASLLLR